MNILVTGGTGFLGGALVPKLREAGHHVRLISRKTLPAAWTTGAQPVEFVQSDLADRHAVRRAIAGVDVIYHFAGLVSFRNEDARKMYELHVDCTRELLRDVITSGAKPRIILASTSGTIAAFTGARVGAESDDYPIETVGRWPYYLSKIYQEKLSIEMCRQHQIPLVILNPSLLMGPGDDRLSSTWTIVKFIQRDIPAMPGGGICLVDVRDVADVALRALTRGEIYGRHLMGLNMSTADFFGRLERLTGVPSPRLKLPKQATILGAHFLDRLAEWRGVSSKLDPQEAEIGEHWFWVNSSKAERELDFHPRDVYETLHDTVAYTYSRLAGDDLPGRKGELRADRSY